MNENTNNQKVVVVAKLKSPVIGFVLAVFFGGLGVDRFYKGGSISIILGIIKLVGFLILSGGWLIFGAAGSVGVFSGAIIIAGIFCVLYVLDIVLVPLGIVLDNRKKLANATQN